MQTVDEQRRQFVFRQALGVGGFGEVYLADMRAPSGLNTAVAVKVLHGGLDPASQAVRRLTDEGQILSMLNHPAIVAVYDLAIIEGRIALVTEFIEGADLPDCLEGDDPIPKGAIYEVIARVADALHAAHQAVDASGEHLGLLHRDVKPRNIRIGRHGQVKLLDFGIATGSGIAREAHTGTNALIGSFPYMAPERFKRAPLTPASDFYSLGCTLYEMLAGEKLFYQEDIAELLVPKTVPATNQEFLEEQFAKLLDTAPETIDILQAMVHVDPTQRPLGPDLVAQLEDLAAAADGVRLARWARSHNWSAQAGEPGSLTGMSVFENEPAGAAAPSAVGDTIHIDTRDVLQTTGTTNLKKGLGAAALLTTGGGLFLLVLLLTIAIGLWISKSGNTDLPIEPTDSSQRATVQPDQPDPVQPNLPTDPPAPATPTEHPQPKPPDGPSREPEPPRKEDGVAVVIPGPASQPSTSAPSAVTVCGPLADLEAKSSAARLSSTDLACLSRSARSVSMRQVDRKKLGRILLLDAQQRCKVGKGCADYEREQPWYFEEVEQSDPDMMLAWATYEKKRNHPAQARTWVRRAMGRKDKWQGVTWVNRVDALLRLDALAAHDLWKQDPKNEEKRNLAKEAAANWANHRARVNRDTTDAMTLCIAAAGSAGPCNARVHDNAAKARIVFLTTPPGASLTVDGEAVGVTPKPLDLSFGSHEITMTLDGKTATKTITVGTEDPKRWSWTPASGVWTRAF